MVFFLTRSSLKSFNRRDKSVYYACQGLLLISALAMLVALISIIIISLTVRSPYIGAEARQFTSGLRLGAFLAIGLCTLGLAVSTLTTRLIASKNRVGMVIVADDNSGFETVESIEINKLAEENDKKIGRCTSKNQSAASNSRDVEANNVIYYEMISSQRQQKTVG